MVGYRCFQALLEKCRCFQLLVEKCRCFNLSSSFSTFMEEVSADTVEVFLSKVDLTECGILTFHCGFDNDLLQIPRIQVYVHRGVLDSVMLDFDAYLHVLTHNEYHGNTSN